MTARSAITGVAAVLYRPQACGLINRFTPSISFATLKLMSSPAGHPVRRQHLGLMHGQ